MLNLLLKNCKGKTSAQVAKTSSIKSFIENEYKKRVKKSEIENNNIPIQDFKKFDMKQYFSYKRKLLKNIKNKNQSQHKKPQPQTQRSQRMKSKINPESFQIISLLGKGSFGEVYLVEKKDTKKLYAMKILDKDILISIVFVLFFY